MSKHSSSVVYKPSDKEATRYLVDDGSRSETMDIEGLIIDIGFYSHVEDRFTDALNRRFSAIKYQDLWGE